MSQLSTFTSGGGGGGSVNGLLDNFGVLASPDGGGDINVIGGGYLVSNATLNTITFTINGATNHTVQLGNVSGGLASLANGTTGQVLHAVTGADPAWSAVSLTADVTGVLPIANGGTNANAMATADGTVYFDGTRLVTTATGTAGWVLTSGGAGIAPAYAVLPNPGSLNYTAVNFAASPYTVLVADEYISVDVTGGAVTILMPNAPATGRIIYIKDKVGLSATNNITVQSVSHLVLIDGAVDVALNTSYEASSFLFNGVSYEQF